VNRWFVGALITLALIVLVSPGIVGHLAEKRVEENLVFATSESDEIVVTTESFERGWFTSEGRHRIALRDGPFRALFEDEAGSQVPSLIIDTHVDHGLVPLTSVSRESGSLKPGLASTVSTVRIDSGAGRIFEVPGKIYSQVGLTGETASRFLMEAGSRKIDDAAFDWQGADLMVRTKPSSGSVAYEGEILPFSFLDQSGGFRLGSITIAGQQQQTPYSFRVGSARLELDSLVVDGGGDVQTAFGRFTVEASNELVGDRVNGAANVLVSGIPAPTLGEMNLAIDIVFSRFDARSLQGVIGALQDAQTSADPQEALANVYPLIERDVQKLLASGLEIRFDQFDVTLPNGDLTTKLHLELPESDTDADFSWPAVILALNASADVRIPVEVFELAEMMSPDVGMLLAMGILKKVDDYYEMRAEYAKGLITVNGAPMPIPLQGL